MSTSAGTISIGGHHHTLEEIGGSLGDYFKGKITDALPKKLTDIPGLLEFFNSIILKLRINNPHDRLRTLVNLHKSYTNNGQYIAQHGDTDHRPDIEEVLGERSTENLSIGLIAKLFFEAEDRVITADANDPDIKFIQFDNVDPGEGSFQTRVVKTKSGHYSFGLIELGKRPSDNVVLIHDSVQIRDDNTQSILVRKGTKLHARIAKILGD